MCADDAGNVTALDEAARAAGVKLDVLVEVNVGANRCGVEPGEPALPLAQAIARSQKPALRGTAGLPGRGAAPAQGGGAARRDRDGVRAVKKTTALLADARIACDTVTGAGTGTYLFEAASGVYHELQAGSYIFMDVDYAKNDWTESGIPRFEHSLFVWTTAMSRPTPDRAVVDAGLKASSVDSGMPRVAELEGVEYVKTSDEHGVLRLSGSVRLAVGDKLKLIPGHCDPTVNLYDQYICVRGGQVEAIWPITARGAVW